MTTWFTSDTHFGDHRVLNIGKRPFASTAEMDEALIAGWNAVVEPDDEVWHLGDVARSVRTAAAVLPRLKGRKRLLIGNNDPAAVVALPIWISKAHYAELELDGVGLVLCHYPFRSWNGMARRVLNLHGHSHGRLKPMLRQFDVGVDARGFRPVRLQDLRG